jgi:Tfp pilus assembly major pilin PilA
LESVQLAYEEVQALQVEFEEVTVPKVVKGMLEARDATATEITATDNKASGKMNVQAFHINDRLFQPFIEQNYLLTYEAMQRDPAVLLEIARLTQDASYTLTTDRNGQSLPPEQQQTMLYTDEQLIDQLPKFLPLPEIDVKIVAYENFLRKQQVLQNLATFLPQASESPGAKYLKWSNIMQLTARYMNLPKDQVVVDDKERPQVEAQEQQQQQQQQQMAMAPEMAKMQLESSKQQLEATKENNRHQEAMMQLQLENARLGLDAQTAAVDAMLGQQDIQMKKDKPSGSSSKSA